MRGAVAACGAAMARDAPLCGAVRHGMVHRRSAVITGGIDAAWFLAHSRPRSSSGHDGVLRRLGSDPRSPCECGVRRRQQPKDRSRGRRPGQPRRRPSADTVPSAAKEQRARVQVSTARRDRRSTGTGASNAARTRLLVTRARPPHVLPAGPGDRVAGALPGSPHGGSAVGVTVGVRLFLTVRTARAQPAHIRKRRDDTPAPGRHGGAGRRLSASDAAAQANGRLAAGRRRSSAALGGPAARVSLPRGGRDDLLESSS